MAHVRTQLRDALIAALAGLPSTGARVGAVQRLPLPPDALPRLSVSVVADASPEGAFDLGRSLVARAVQVAVVAWASGSGDLEATLNQVALEVESALAASVTVAGVVVDLAYQSADLELESGLDSPPARLTLQYTATLWTPADDPGAFATL